MNIRPACGGTAAMLLRLFFLVFGLLALTGSAHAALTINSVTLNGGASVTVASGATISVTVSETNTGGSNWRSTRFTTSPATSTTCVNTPNHDGNGSYSETFSITAPSTPGTYDAIFRASGDDSCGGTTSALFTLTGGIIVAPLVTSINRSTFDPTAANTAVTWTVSFDASVTGVDAADFQLVQSGGATGASITSVTGSGTTWTVTANTGTGPTGTLRLDLIDNDTIMAGGVPLGGAGAGNGNFSGQSYTLVQSVCATAANVIFCDDFERSNPGTVGNGWTVTPANVTNCTGAAGNTGCAGIDRDIPPFNNYTVPHATNTRSMFTRWNIVSVDSPVVNLAGRPAALLSFWIRRGHDSFSECPEATTENYLVQYYASDGTWKILAQYPSSPSAALCDGRIFTPTIQLPPDALHANFRMRFYQPGGSGKSGSGGAPGVVGYDYWHMDDVLIVEAPASSYVGAFCDNFEGGLGRWSITAEGAPGGAKIGDAGLGSTDYQSAGHELDTRWGYVVASTLRTDMTGVTGDITYWVKSGTTSNRDPDSGEDLVVEYFNSAGTWTALATYPGTAAAGTVFNGSHPLPADAKHPAFRLRFRQLNGSGYDYDYWHIDDVCAGTILPTADLALAKTRGAALVPGANIPYTLTVTNNGPGTLNGSLEIVDTLPASLGYLSFSGAGWACSVNVQIVTCNWNGTLPSGATAPPLTLTAQLSLAASGVVTNTATVTGTVVDNTPANNTATESGTVIAATLIAQYHLEELLWNGTAGEMKDTAGYAGGPFNGAAIGSAYPSPALSSPARTGNPGTCGYATLPGPAADGGAFTVSGLPVSTSAGAKTSVAFWMYWDGTDNVMPVGWMSHSLLLQGGSFGFHSGNGDIFGIASAGLADGWHHVVAVFTNGSVASNQLYIDGNAQTLTQRQGAPNLANAVVGSTLRTGGWGQDNSYRFSGRIDEMLVYKDALVQADVTAIYNATHPCAAAVDHYELSLPTGGIACLAATATVTACANSSSPCTSPSAAVNGQTASLGVTPVGTATLGSSTVTFNASGVASTTLSYPSLTTDGTVVTVNLSGEAVPALNLRKCCPDGANCVVANSCNITFNTAGFIFSDTADGNVWTIPTQKAGTSSGTLYLRSVQTNTTTKKCESGLTGSNVPVDFAYRCIDPETCYSSNLMSVNGGAATLIARNDNSVADASLSYLPANLNFDANGNAPFTFVYSDVGRVKLYAKKTLTADFTKTPPVTAHTLRGNTNAFVVKPDHFVLTGIQQTAAPNLANPGASDAGGNKFVKAGEAFSVTATAVTSAGSATPNYGRETAPEGVRLTSALVSGLGLSNNPALDNASSFGAFSNGTATGTTFAWKEVGIITLTPSVADGDYLGAGDVSGTASGNVGRFYAAQFALSNGVLGNRADLAVNGSVTAASATLTLAAAAGVQAGDQLAITGAGSGGAAFTTSAAAVSADGLTVTLASPALTSVAGVPVYIGKFAYVGEPVHALFTLTAKAVDGTTTLQNYNWPNPYVAAKQFAKLDPLAAVTAGSGGPLGLGAVNSAATRTPFPPCGATPAHPCLIPAQATSGPFVGGVASVSVPFSLYRAAPPSGPFAALDVGVAPQDSDGATLGSYDLDTVNVVAGTNNHGKVGRTEARFGRMRFTNAFGSELLDLVLPMEAQHWDGTAFVRNTWDYHTRLVNTGAGTSNFGLSNYRRDLASGETTLLPASSVFFNKGATTMRLTRPGAGNSGSVRVCADLDAVAGTGDTTCQAAGAVANMPYLQGGAGFNIDPSADITFGTHKSGPVIYLREGY